MIMKMPKPEAKMPFIRPERAKKVIDENKVIVYLHYSNNLEFVKTPASPLHPRKKLYIIVSRIYHC